MVVINLVGLRASPFSEGMKEMTDVKDPGPVLYSVDEEEKRNELKLDLQKRFVKYPERSRSRKLYDQYVTSPA